MAAEKALCTLSAKLEEVNGLKRHADLPRQESGVPERRNDYQLVAIPLAGLGELDIQRLSCRRYPLTVRRDHLPGKRSRGAGDDGDPVAAAELDRVRRVHVDVREDLDELLHRCGVCFPSI